MNEILSKFGKTSSVVGENAALITLLALFGKQIPPDKLILIHTLIMGVKTIYLHWSPPPSLVAKAKEVISKEHSIMPISSKELSTIAAERIVRTSKAQGGRIKIEQMAEIIFEETNKTEKDILDGVLNRLSPIEKKVLEQHYEKVS